MKNEQSHEYEISGLSRFCVWHFFGFLTIIVLLFSGSVQYADAISGACSSHGGVNCSAGMQPNGKVYCNDYGWTESMVEYDFMVMCQNQGSKTEDLIIQEYMRDKRIFGPKYENAFSNSDNHKALKDKCMSTMYQNSTYIARLNDCYYWVLDQEKIISSTPICPKHSIIYSYAGGNKRCLCDEGYYDYDPKDPGAPGVGPGVCVKGNPPFRIDKYVQGIDQSNAVGWPPVFCEYKGGVMKDSMCIFSVNAPAADPPQYKKPLIISDPEKSNQECQTFYGKNSVWLGEVDDKGNPECGCGTSYEWNSDKTTCKPSQSLIELNQGLCKTAYGENGVWISDKIDANVFPECGCVYGYELNRDKTACINSKPSPANNGSGPDIFFILPMIALSGGAIWAIYKLAIRGIKKYEK